MGSKASTEDVVVTGLGLMTPAGRGVEASWQGVVAGVGAAARDPWLEKGGVGVTLAARVPPFDPDAELGRGTERRTDRFTQLARIAAAEALAQAGLRGGSGDHEDDGDDGADRDRIGIVLGSGIGGAETWDSAYATFLADGEGKVGPHFVPGVLSNTAAGLVAISTGARGPNLTVNTACAAGATALHVARDLIRAGSADVMIAGGAEAGITPLSVAAFDRMGALSRTTDPRVASRPFDVARDGFVMGEGAGVLILERAEHAAARGAVPLARLAGCGASADAHHVTAPPPDGGGAVLALRRALEDAGLGPADVDHYNAHGTSTPLNDLAEARAVRTVFGPAADDLAVTSTKGVTGHQLGAAGAVEAVFALLALRDGRVPPTAGLAEQDPQIDLAVVSGRPLERPLRAVLSASFGFGGQNAALVLTPA